jgi:hypothetical protein
VVRPAYSRAVTEAGALASILPLLQNLPVAVVDYVNTSREIAAADRRHASGQRFATRQASVAFERGMQLERVRHERERELKALEADLRQETDRSRLLEQAAIGAYPIAEGPGHLRESLRLMSPDLADAPLVVLVPPFNIPADETRWLGLRHLVLEELRQQLVSASLISLHETRALAWPHANLYWGDLYGLPTLVVQVGAARDVLDVSLGQQHLVAEQPVPAVGMRSVFRHRRIRTQGDWPPGLLEAVAAIDGGATGTDDLEQLNLELAARVVTLAVTAAVDSYYLGRYLHYDERFDAVAAPLGRSAERWPTDLGVPLRLVADIPYHLLHVARRHFVRAETGPAEAALRRSLAALVHADYALGPADRQPTPPVVAAALARATGPYRERLDALEHEFPHAREVVRTLTDTPEVSGGAA